MLLQCDDNTYWRKSRNHYMAILLFMVKKSKVEGIFAKMPTENLPYMNDIEFKRICKELGIDK